MGQTKSKNVAKAIAEVGTDLSNSVVVAQDTVEKISTDFNLRDCFISGTVDFKNVGVIIGTNRQIVNSIQSINVKNNIAQIINQKAIAVTKPLNFDHKKSTQVTSRFASESVNIIQIISEVAHKGSYIKQGFECDRQFIIGDVRVGYNTQEEFWQNQVGNYSQTENISNNILQDIVQKTGKNVTGISLSIVIIVAIITIAFIIAAYPLGGIIKRHNILFTGIICLGIISLPIILYLTRVYPFYNDPSSCTPYARLIKAKKCDECKNIKIDTYNLDTAPPLRYMNNIFYDETDKKMPFGLLNMVVSRLCIGNECLYNQGYNAQVWYRSGRYTWKEDKNPPHGLPPLPNPLSVPKACDDNNYCMIPPQYNSINNDYISKSYTPTVYSPYLDDGLMKFNSGIIQRNVNLDSNDDTDVKTRLNTMAVLNETEWRNYINKYGEIGALHARFVLTDFLGYDTSIYIHDDEEIRLSDGTKGIAREHKDKIFKFSDFNPPSSLANRINSGGNVTGPIGECVDRKYKIGHMFSRYVNWIIIGIFVLILVVIVYFSIPLRHQLT